MPRLRESKREKRLNAFRCMTGRVSGGREIVSDEQMGKHLGVTKRTIQNWRRDCSTMRVKDLWILQDKFHFFDSEILELVKGENINE